MVVGEAQADFKKVYIKILAQNRESFRLPCARWNARQQYAEACKQTLTIYSKGSFKIGWILAWLFLVNERPYPQPNIEIRKPKKELKVTLISVTICSLIFFICTLESAGLRPWQTRFIKLVAHKTKLRWKFLILSEISCHDPGNLSKGILHHLHAFGVHGRAFRRARCSRV